MEVGALQNRRHLANEDCPQSIQQDGHASLEAREADQAHREAQRQADPVDVDDLYPRHATEEELAQQLAKQDILEEEDRSLGEDRRNAAQGELGIEFVVIESGRLHSAEISCGRTDHEESIRHRNQDG